VHVRSHSRAKNPKGTLALFARPELAVNGGGIVSMPTLMAR
jgi:hypothetical protein